MAVIPEGNYPDWYFQMLDRHGRRVPAPVDGNGVLDPVAAAKKQSRLAKERAMAEILNISAMAAHHLYVIPASAKDQVNHAMKEWADLAAAPQSASKIDAEIRAAEQNMKVVASIEKAYIERIRREAFAEGMAEQKERSRIVNEAKEPLPIHRALSRMLNADERYENRAYLPSGQLWKQRGED